MGGWRSAAVSESGKRATNEDAFLEAPEFGLWAVADGMGGHQHGEIASATAVQALREATAAGYSLASAVELAHLATWEKALALDSDMGTTLVALKLEADSTYNVAWVGDSRAYRWEQGQLAQLTSDHTVVQRWVDQGLLSPEEARTHPYGHVLSAVLGATSEPSPDIYHGSTSFDDLFLLCSDGLTDTLDRERITELVESTPPSELPSTLEQAARVANNPHQDNLTAVVVWWEDST